MIRTAEALRVSKTHSLSTLSPLPPMLCLDNLEIFFLPAGSSSLRAGRVP